eukprot:256423_1
MSSHSAVSHVIDVNQTSDNDSNTNHFISCSCSSINTIILSIVGFIYISLVITSITISILSNSHDLEGFCTTPSFIPNILTLLYVFIYCLFLFYAGFESFREIHTNQKDNDNKLKLWYADLQTKQECYLEVIPHIFDTATDLGVIIEFFLAAYFIDTGCNEVDMVLVFWLTFSVFIIYRMVTSIQIYLFTKDGKRAILQCIFDYELIRACALNYKLYQIDHQIKEPCDAQRWISTLEATFEAAPEFVIQLYFVMKTNILLDFSNPIYHISLIASLYTLVSHTVNDDKLLNIRAFLNTTIRLYIFRFIDITNHLIGIAIWWITAPVSFIICMICYVVIIVLTCQITKHWELLFAIIRLEISQTHIKLGGQARWAGIIYIDLWVTIVQCFERVAVFGAMIDLFEDKDSDSKRAKFKKHINPYLLAGIIYVVITFLILMIVLVKMVDVKLRKLWCENDHGQIGRSRNLDHIMESGNYKVLDQYMLFGFYFDWRRPWSNLPTNYMDYIQTRNYMVLIIILKQTPLLYGEEFAIKMCEDRTNGKWNESQFNEIMKLFTETLVHHQSVSVHEFYSSIFNAFCQLYNGN